MKRLIKKNAQYLYHGTTLENAKQILQSMTIMGTRASIPPMYSLSVDMETAEGFGPIIFCFQNLTGLTEVVYTQEWLKSHPKIADYIFNGDWDGSESGLSYMQGEAEFVGVGNLIFTEDQLDKILISYKVDDIENIINELKDINPNIKIVEG